MRLPFQLDRYTLVEQIGAGAFGQVYRAEVRGDMGFVSDFAVKVLDAGVVARNPNVARSMAEEARLLSQLDHPNIVKVIDFKHVDHAVLGSVYFMVMEFVRGVDVSDILARLSATAKFVPATAVLHMGLMVSDALSHAHALVDRNGQPLGLVHRDLKPQNLMVNFRGQVKVLDFGIAKAKAHRLAAETQEGQTKGTVFYMSPEQLAGEELDGRSDLYSLGTILYELLLGRRLLDVEVNNPADLARAMHQAFDLDIETRLAPLRAHLERGGAGELPPEAIDGWIALLRQLLQKDARYRPDAARVLSSQLEWLRARHPPAEQRDYWVQRVEDCASQRSNTPREEVPSLDGLPVAGGPRSFAMNTHEFFGMEGAEQEEETLPFVAAKAQVPESTRAMSAVGGTVRTWGGPQRQAIGPLPQLLEEIRSRDATVVVPNAPEIEFGELNSGDLKVATMEPEAVSRKGSDAPTPVVGVAAVAGAPTSLPPVGPVPGRPAPTAYMPGSAPNGAAKAPARPPKARPETRSKAPDRNLVLFVGGGVATLLAIMLVLLLRGSPSEPDSGAGRDETPPPDLAVADKANPEASTPAPLETAAAAPHPTTPAAAPATTPPPPNPAAAAPSATPSRDNRVANIGAPAPPTRAKAEATPAPVVAGAAVPVEATPAVAESVAEAGRLHISAVPRCKVEIDGKDYGTTDETRRGIALPAGSYAVRFLCDDAAECEKFKKRTAKKTLVVEAGKTSHYTADFYELQERLQK